MWKTFSTITICNIKLIRWTELQKMDKNLVFGSLDHSKMHFYEFWVILHDLVTLPNVGKHLVLSQYAIWSPYDQPILRKRPILKKIIQTAFFDFWMILNDLVMLKNVENIYYYHNIQLSSWSDHPILRKWPILNWIIQKHIFVIFEWSGFFPEKPPSTFLVLIVRNIHAKNRKNP